MSSLSAHSHIRQDRGNDPQVRRIVHVVRHMRGYWPPPKYDFYADVDTTKYDEARIKKAIEQASREVFDSYWSVNAHLNVTQRVNDLLHGA